MLVIELVFLFSMWIYFLQQEDSPGKPSFWQGGFKIDFLIFFTPELWLEDLFLICLPLSFALQWQKLHSWTATSPFK